MKIKKSSNFVIVMRNLKINKTITEYEIKLIIDNIFNKTNVLVKYPIEIKYKDSGNSDGYFIDKTIHINANPSIDAINQIERIVFHEFLHIYLQKETEYFYDILVNKYCYLYLRYLNEFVDSYQLIWGFPNTDILCVFKQNNDVGYCNQTKLKNEIRLSPNLNQFKMLSEFIVHNVDNYFYGSNQLTIDNGIKEMVEFTMSLINESNKNNMKQIKKELVEKYEKMSYRDW